MSSRQHGNRCGESAALRSSLVRLILAVAAVGCLLSALSACGGDDLQFPGDIPKVPTAVPTETPTS